MKDSVLRPPTNELLQRAPKLCDCNWYIVCCGNGVKLEANCHLEGPPLMSTRRCRDVSAKRRAARCQGLTLTLYLQSAACLVIDFQIRPIFETKKSLTALLSPTKSLWPLISFMKRRKARKLKGSYLSALINAAFSTFFCVPHFWCMPRGAQLERGLGHTILYSNG